jgi:IclR family acetate operon transcriptional repressor
MPKATIIKSVARAISVLNLLAEMGPDGVPLRALSEELQMNSGTLHHLLATLKEHHMVAQDALTKHYRLGVHLVKLGNAALGATSLASLAQDYLREIGEDTGHRVSLLAFYGLLRTPLTHVASRRPLRAQSAPHDVSTLHATGSGKLLLAYLPEQELMQYLAQTRLERFTEATITDRDQLLEELQRIRSDGFAIDRGEYGSPVWCIAAPVQDASRRVAGCLDLVFPIVGYQSSQVSEMGESIRLTAQKLSERLLDIGLVVE